METTLLDLMSEILMLPKEEIVDSLSMKDTSVWDSLKHMELVVGIEGTFGIELTTGEIVTMTNVEAIKRTLRSRERVER